MSQCLVGVRLVCLHEKALELRLVRAGISLTSVTRNLRILVAGLVLANLASAASKPHVVGFGKPVPVKVFIGPLEDKTIDISVRALYVDAKLREFTTGKQHDVTDREFVIRRAFRINDALPDDPHKSPKWLWQRGGWLLVNRSSGKITQLKLPDFDPFYSEVSWYRDYAAYCGVTNNAERVLAVVAQMGVKKPLYRKELGKANGGDSPESDCAVPQWERQPARNIPSDVKREVQRERERPLRRCGARIPGGRTVTKEHKFI